MYAPLVMPQKHGFAYDRYERVFLTKLQAVLYAYLAFSGLFNEAYVATLGSDFIVKRIQRGKRSVDLNLWTLQGQCDITTVPSVNFRFADAVVIVFAVNDDKSMLVLDQWRQKAEEIVSTDTIFALVANKCDMKRMQARLQEKPVVFCYQ